MESYSLDHVAKEVLGEGKVELDHGNRQSDDDRAKDIVRLFKEDRERLVDYNLTDARLAAEIVEHFQLVELNLARSQLTGLPLDRVSSSIAAFDFLYLLELNKRKLVAPTIADPPASSTAITGGHVLTPLPGLYRNVLVFDFKSLYPSVMRTFEIDPAGYLGMLAGDVAEDRDLRQAIVAPNGAVFRRDKSILSLLLADLLPRRAKAKASGDLVGSHAIKILMNSFYGVLGTPACRFFDPNIANAITSFGRDLLLWSRD